MIKTRLKRAEEEHRAWLNRQKGNKEQAKTIEVDEGSSNVFADLGLPNPEERLAKADLAIRIAGAGRTGDSPKQRQLES